MGNITRMKREALLKRKRRVRKRISGSPERPRLTVFRSNRNIYAQIVVDSAAETGSCQASQTLVAASSLKLTPHEVPEGVAGKRAVAYQVGRDLAARALEKGIAKVVFDRHGYLYHGRVAALAQGVREGGIEF
jgi:large subunit ribosomal protein L18